MTAVTPCSASTSRSSRLPASRPATDGGIPGQDGALVVPETPALATASCAEAGASATIRRARSSVHRRSAPGCVQPGPQFVLPMPSTTELPNGTTVPFSDELWTSTALTTYVEPTVAVKAPPETSAVWSPEPA